MDFQRFIGVQIIRSSPSFLMLNIVKKISTLVRLEVELEQAVQILVQIQAQVLLNIICMTGLT